MTLIREGAGKAGPAERSNVLFRGKVFIENHTKHLVIWSTRCGFQSGNDTAITSLSISAHIYFVPIHMNSVFSGFSRFKDIQVYTFDTIVFSAQT